MTASRPLRSCLLRLARLGTLLLAAAATPAGADDADELSRAFERDTIVVEADSGICYRFDVWLATTAPQHRRGLMYVRELPRFAGMLFVYPDDDVRSMWMKNTYIPLDILFIRADGRVANVAEHTEPLTLTSIRAAEPVRYVLELNAGVTDALDIGPASIVHVP
jgi:uncharacterized membrane protein (UPF0127 family)